MTWMQRLAQCHLNSEGAAWIVTLPINWVGDKLQALHTRAASCKALVGFYMVSSAVLTGPPNNTNCCSENSCWSDRSSYPRWEMSLVSLLFCVYLFSTIKRIHAPLFKILYLFWAKRINWYRPVQHEMPIITTEVMDDVANSQISLSVSLPCFWYIYLKTHAKTLIEGTWQNPMADSPNTF